jgi:nucleoside-diphosphate-sugar epimerase
MASDAPLATVLGGTGFIGSRVLDLFPQLGFRCEAPGRGEPLAGRRLGHVVYCIGVTSDFRSRPHDTVEAHVCRLLEVMRTTEWETLLYLSSARLYRRASQTSESSARFEVTPADPDQLYDLTKLAGEALLLADGRRTISVRISNVYGVDPQAQNFFCSLVRAAVDDGEITLRSAPGSRRDYVSVDDVVRMLAAIVGRGRHRTYNIASGVLVSTADLTAALRQLTGCRVTLASEATTVSEPLIDITRAREELGFVPSRLLQDLPALVERYRAGGR